MTTKEIIEAIKGGIIVEPNQELRIAAVAIENKKVIGIITGYSIFDEAIAHIHKGEAVKVMTSGNVGSFLRQEIEFKVVVLNPFKLYNSKKIKYLDSYENPLKQRKVVWVYKVVDDTIVEFEDLIIKE